MDSVLDKIQSLNYETFAIGLVVLAIGMILSKIIAKTFSKIALKSSNDIHVQLVTQKIIFWSLGFGVILITLDTMGVNLTAVVATAGFLTVAVGFAAQTAFSNIISGIFLLFDKPFVIGEGVQIGQVSGVVTSLDLLSTKIRRWDNVYVRIPNSTLLTETIQNLNRHNIRRIDIPVGIAFKEDVKVARNVILEAVKSYSNVLEEPEATVYIDAFGESGFNFIIRAWIPTNVFLQAKSEIIEIVKTKLDESKIEIPFPHRTLFLRENGNETSNLKS